MSRRPSLSAAGLGRLVSGLCIAVVAASLPAHAAIPIAGVWRIEHPVAQVRTVDGHLPPLKPDAARIYGQRIAARRAGDTSFDNVSWCASIGMPRAMFIDSPFEIVVSEPYVAFLHEWNWWARVVYLTGAMNSSAGSGLSPAAPEEAPVAVPPGPPRGGMPPGPPGGPPRPLREGALNGPMGVSHGHWEGDSLVIQTDQIGALTLIDGAGLPHGDALKVIETLRMRGPDVLEDRIRIEDPGTFTGPWETMVTYRRQPGARLHEDVCLDRIRDGSPAVRQ